MPGDIVDTPPDMIEAVKLILRNEKRRKRAKIFLTGVVWGMILLAGLELLVAVSSV